MHCSSVWAVVVQGYRGILSTEKYFKAWWVVLLFHWDCSAIFTYKTCDLKAWGRTIPVFTGEDFLGCKSFHILLLVSKSYCLHKTKKKKKIELRMASTSQPLRGKRACKKIFWAVFPHACFILSLVIYAFLGAVMFSHIEGNRKVNLSEEYRNFLQDLWYISRNLTGMYQNNKIT